MLVPMYRCRLTTLLVTAATFVVKNFENLLFTVCVNFICLLMMSTSYDLEFTVARHLVAVSTGNLLYQVR